MTSCSPEIVRFSFGGHRFAYDPNSLLLLELEAHDEESQVQSCGISCRPNFRVSGILPTCQTLVLQTCYSCNLDCSYCFAKQKLKNSPSMMTMDILERAGRMLLPLDDLPHTDHSLSFFGGEPLMNFEFVRQAVLWFERLAAPRLPVFHMTTNGTLITPEIADFLIEHRFGLIVSLDGPQEVHDRMRVDHHGRGSFDKVMQGLRVLQSRGFNNSLTLRATFGPDTSNELLRIVRFLNELCYQGLGRYVSVEPAFLTESTCINKQDLRYSMQEGLVEDLRQAYLDVAAWMVDEVRSGANPTFHHLTKMVERLYYRSFWVTECGGGCGYMSVDPAGVIYACHRPTVTQIGHLMHGGIDEALRARWIDNRTYNRTGCLSCPLRFICGGGCREESLCESGDIHLPVRMDCLFKRIFFDTSAWIIAELGQRIITWIQNPSLKFLTQTVDSSPKGDNTEEN